MKICHPIKSGQMAWWRWLCFLWGARFPLIVLAPGGQLGSASHGARYPTHHWSPLKKRVSQKIMPCVSWCFTQCVFLFLGSAPCTTLFTLSQNSIGILTEAIHLYTSDKISIFLCFFSLVFSLVFWGKRLCENKTLHIYWTEPPWKELRMIWKSAQYQRFY